MHIIKLKASIYKHFVCKNGYELNSTVKLTTAVQVVVFHVSLEKLS